MDLGQNSTNRFFATNGDYPSFTNRSTKTWSLKTDWTHQVGRHRHAGAARRADGRHLIADLALARADVDGGPGSEIALGDHQPDPPGTARHERHLAVERKQGAEVDGHATPSSLAGTPVSSR